MKRYYTDMKADMDTSAAWVEFHEGNQHTRRLFKLASSLAFRMLDEKLGPTEVSALLCAPEYREESMILAMLVTDSFVMMDERQLGLDVIKALHIRLHG